MFHIVNLGFHIVHIDLAPKAPNFFRFKVNTNAFSGGNLTNILGDLETSKAFAYDKNRSFLCLNYKKFPPAAGRIHGMLKLIA